jgi:beta-lactamase regulating signal transducer with metallopeptidase domain
MPQYLLYPIKLSCSLALIWLFYRGLLRNLTFYNLNRWYLAGYAILCFLFPLIDIGPMLEKDAVGGPLLVTQFIPAMSAYTTPLTKTPLVRSASFNPWLILVIVMTAGSFILLLRTTLRWFSLLKIKRRSTRISDRGNISIYQVDERITPFSFGNAVFINRHLHTEKEWDEIILHEYVHIRQHHTLDILLAELITILNWYNPFSWAIRYSIRQNLEFIADIKVLGQGLDRKGYQYHLLNLSGDSRYRIGNNFNFSSLKKRIIMMNKIRSARLHLIRFLFILPLIAVLLVAFRDRFTGLSRHSSGPIFVNIAGIVISAPEKTPLAGVSVREQGSGLQTVTDDRGYFKLHIPVKENFIAHIRLDYSKPGYDSSFYEQSLPSIKKTMGLVDPMALVSRSVTMHVTFMSVPVFGKVPEDPGYEDARAGLQDLLLENQALDRINARNKAHPEVALFYDTEDRLKHIVVLKDGTVERYGYPDTPPISVMEDKYGPLPVWPASFQHPVEGYLRHWEAIAAQAEKEFHTTNPNVLHVIFPGDSRVIVVPVNGKTRFYDMDSDQPNERQEFEETYGKLPDCVPPTYHPERSAKPAAPH